MQPVADTLRDWSEDVGDVPAERIRLCVRFKLDLDPSEKEREYYRANITRASLSRPSSSRSSLPTVLSPA